MTGGKPAFLSEKFPFYSDAVAASANKADATVMQHKK